MKKEKKEKKNDKSAGITIEQIKKMPRGDDGYESIKTIGELEDWPGYVEDW